MLQQATLTANPTPRRQVKPCECAAEKCCHCGRELPTGKGVNVPFIGVVGPDCVKKYAALLSAIEQVNGMEFYEWDMGSQRLAHVALCDLRGAGMAIEVVDVRPGVKALEVRGLQNPRKPKAVVESWERRRERFEQQLQLAAAERAEEGAA